MSLECISRKRKHDDMDTSFTSKRTCLQTTNTVCNNQTFALYAEIYRLSNELHELSKKIDKTISYTNEKLTTLTSKLDKISDEFIEFKSKISKYEHPSTDYSQYYIS
tara:strand:+ start:147 stop:467 length:321 start_codon:yes stop_codon:yes gene_type:complete